jgi:hypothetical protein
MRDGKRDNEVAGIGAYQALLDRQYARSRG